MDGMMEGSMDKYKWTDKCMMMDGLWNKRMDG